MVITTFYRVYDGDIETKQNKKKNVEIVFNGFQALSDINCPSDDLELKFCVGFLFAVCCLLYTLILGYVRFFFFLF